MVISTYNRVASNSEAVSFALPQSEELNLQQLLQLQFWESRISRARENEETSRNTADAPPSGLPREWMLTGGTTLYDWQRECVDAWFSNRKSGVIKVVTGAGKTLLALAIAEQLQNTESPNLRVAIVVPTVVLLEQWRDELLSRSNLPADAIGLMGGGHAERFSERVRVLICVLNSASRKLAIEVERAGISGNLLLVVDECHRAGAKQMQRVFQTGRAYSLGLSATPDRDDSPDSADPSESCSNECQTFEETVLGRELGPVIFELSYAEAIHRNILPPFRIVHYGLSLLPNERENYERMSREIRQLRTELESGNRRGLGLIRWCRSRAAAGNPKASRLVALTGERKRLLYRMRQRSAAVIEILKTTLQRDESSKAILFHESIDEVMSLFVLLREAGYAVVAEHSAFPDPLRAQSLRLFRNGAARVIVSARSLIEGFNVPSADIGIVVASSSSVRQRIQTLGRLLRRSRQSDGSEKQATLCVLYASKTVDELIYEKEDWESFVGAERNEYYEWANVESDDRVRLDAPPRLPPVEETSLKVESLQPGTPYPGSPKQSLVYTIDTQGTVRDEVGCLVHENPQLREMLVRHTVVAGRFRVTPVNKFVLKHERVNSGWRWLYVGQLADALEKVESGSQVEKADTDYAPGDEYPLDRVTGRQFSVLQRDKRLIAEKTRGRVRFVLPLHRIEDSEKRTCLRDIQSRLAQTYSSGRRISKITVTPAGQVVYVYNNRAYFVGHAPEGADGFVFEDGIPQPGQRNSK